MGGEIRRSGDRHIPGLSESADEAERAEALAQAIAVEGLVRTIAPVTPAEGDHGEGEYGEADYGEGDYGEADYGEADYVVTYDRVYLG